MVLVKMLMKISPPTMRGSLVLSMATISPSWREVSPAESLRRRSKVLQPKFRLETVAHHPKSLLYIFLGQMHLYTRKWGPEVGQGLHEVPGRAWGVACPGASWAPGWPPLVLFASNIFYIFQNNSSWNFSSFGDVQNMYLDRAFSGPEFQLPTISLFVWILHITREKALELLHKVLYWLKIL